MRFGLTSLLCVGFWLLIVYDRIVLGKHTLNQVFFGSQVGIWCALFSHFCMRDLIFRHITRLTHEKPDAQIKAFKYILCASLLTLTCVLLTVITGLVMASDLAGGSKVDPQWFLNIRHFYCPTFKFEVDGQGEVVTGGIYRSSVKNYVYNSAVLFLYIGQVMFRNKGSAYRLGTDAYTSRKGFAL